MNILSSSMGALTSIQILYIVGILRLGRTQGWTSVRVRALGKREMIANDHPRKIIYI